MLISPMPAAANGCGQNQPGHQHAGQCIGHPTVASRDSATVTLSVEARAIQALLQNKPDEVNASSAAGLTIFWPVLASKYTHRGKAAPMLAELPESADPARLALARQAVNFVLAGGATLCLRRTIQPKPICRTGAQKPVAHCL